MANSIGDVFVNVVTDTSGLEKSLTESLEKGFSGINSRLGGLAAVAGAGVAAVVREFAPLEREILKIFQLQGLEFDESLFQALTTQVTDIADEVGLRAEPIGAAIALGVGRGFSEQASMELAKISGDLAVALGSEVQPAMQSLTAAINVYGEANLSAASAAEILLETVNMTGAPLADVARQLGNITPVANHLGVEFDEVGAAIGTMTAQGLTLAESTTQLRTLFTELSRETSRGGKVFEAISGKTFPQFIKQGGTLQQAIELINTASQKSGVSVQELTGNYNSANAVVALAGENQERFSAALAQTTQETGSLANAVDAANTGSIRRFQEASAGIHTALDRIGLAIRPLTKEIETQLVRGMNFFSEVLNKVAAQLSTVDWTPLISAVRSTADLFARFGPVVLAVIDAIFAIDWAGIGTAIKVGFAPLFLTISALVNIAVALGEAFAKYLLPGISRILPYLTPLIFAFSFLASLWLSQIVVIAALGKVFLTVTKYVTLLRIAVMLLWKAFMKLTIIGRIITIITLLAAAFVYAWENSEKFQAIVRAAFVKTAEGIGAAVKAIISLAAMWVNAYLMGFKKILDGLGHLPDWLGGGKFDDASAAVQRLINGVNDIRDSLHGLVDDAVAAATALAAVGASGGVVMSRAGQLPPGALLAQKRAAAAAEKARGGGGLSPNLGALDKVLNPEDEDKALAAARNRLKKMVTDLFKDTVKLVKNIGEKSFDSIDSGFDSLIEKYNTAITEATEQGNKTVTNRLKATLKRVRAFEKTLLSLAKKRDAALAKLDTAEQALKSLRDQAAQFSASLRDAFVDIGSVATATAGIDVTFRGIRNNLKDAIRTTQAFDKAMRQLQKLNLNPESLRQLAEAGPAALEQAQALARSGASGIKEINDLQTELDNLANKNAKNLTNEFFSAGVKAAEGLVKGLKSQKNQIIAAMEDIADALVKSVKKGLKIQSPSQVFDEEIGRQIPAGLTQGIRRGTPDVSKALEAMTAGRNTGVEVGGITINGVSDPAAARRAGILAGEGVKSVLEKRAVSQTLAGVR